MTLFQRPICVSIRLRWLYPVAAYRALALGPDVPVERHEVAAETVAFPDDEHVALPQGAQAAVESRPIVAYAGSEVVIEVGWVVDAFGTQGVALQVQRLGAIRLSDAGVADPHVSQTFVYDMRTMVPPCGRVRVSYPVSDSMYCIRRAKENGSTNRSDKAGSGRPSFRNARRSCCATTL